MVKRIIGIFLCFAFQLPSLAQQNIINVPSSEVLPEGQIILKEATRIVPDEFVRLTPSVIYGVGKGVEVSGGVGTTLNSEHVVRGDFGIKKVFFLSNSTRLTTGGRLNPYFNQERDADTFAYAHLSQRIRKTRTSLTAGAYVSSKNDYIPSHVGALLGIDQVIIPNKLRVAVDYMSGGDEYSAFAVGLKYRPLPTVSVTSAVLMSAKDDERVAFNISVSKYIALKKRSYRKKNEL